MIKARTTHLKWNTDHFFAERPMIKRPKITGEKIVDGVRFYLGEGKEYLANLFDEMFLPKVKLKVRKNSYKGVNPSSKVEVLYTDEI